MNVSLLARRVTVFVFLLALVTWGSHPGLAGSDIPFPDTWEQWQPEIDRGDQRLAVRRISVWEGGMALQDMLSDLSEQTSVDLTASSDVAALPVSLYAENALLEEVMVSMARLTEGYWAFGRGDAPNERRYRLRSYQLNNLPIDVWFDQYSDELTRARASRMRPAREARLALYKEAFSLSADDLLQRYEESDPWLCADLLDPVTRPMLGEVLSLDGADTELLLGQGELVRPLSVFDSDYRKHMSDWCNGRWGLSGGWRLGPNPDTPSIFPSSEQRWSHAVVRVRWTDDRLHCLLEIPDVGGCDATVVRMRTESPYEASAAESAPSDLAYAELSPEPDQTSPNLMLKVDLSECDRAEPPFEAVLEHVARQCNLRVLANHVPDDQVAYSPLLRGDEVTVGDVLNELRRQRSGLLSWRFLGRYLIVSDFEVHRTAAATLPESFITRWDKLLSPGNKFSLQEIADLLAEANVMQVMALEEREERVISSDLLLFPIRTYGLLGTDAQQALHHGEELGFAGIQEPCQRDLLRKARRTRPWLTMSDLGQSVLRALPRTLSSGKQGISLVVEYNLDDAPGERDILFTAPLTFDVGTDGFIG